MWSILVNKWGPNHNFQPRRRRHWRRASKSPTLPAIPELTLASDVSPFQLDQDLHGLHPNERRNRRDSKERTRTNHNIRRLQLCLLIFAPGHIILTSLLLLHPRYHRPHYQIRLQKHHNDSRGKTKEYTTGSLDADETLHHGSTMSTKRVATLSFDKNLFNFSRLRKLLPSTVHDGLESQPTHGYESDTSTYHRDGNRSADCTPMAKWQTMSFSTCNSLHELNIFSSSPSLSQFYPNRRRLQGLPVHKLDEYQVIDEKMVPISDSYTAKMLGNRRFRQAGWFRQAWEVTDSTLGTKIAVKTLRLERDFLEEYFELHRRDAVAMERLTSSPYVMDIHGYCGQSVMTELAFSGSGLDTLYDLANGMKGVDTPYVLHTKLQIAAMISFGLSHIHNVAVDGIGIATKDRPAAIAHYDINPRNVIMSRSGKPKINDFNVAEFLKWNSKTLTQDQCGFESRFHEPWWRAPEEMIFYGNDTADYETVEFHPKHFLSEKVDVYSLGNTIYYLLTGLEPHGKEDKKSRQKGVSNLVARGDKPFFPDQYANSVDKAVEAIRKAIRLCWELDPNRRPSAFEIAEGLSAALVELKQIPIHNHSAT